MRLSRIRLQKLCSPYFLRYAAIGVLVLTVDLLGVATLSTLGVRREFAISFSFLAAMCVQFYLNRRYNFQTGKSLIWQITSYACVTGLAAALAVVLVDTICDYFRFSVLLSKILTLPIITPISFLGHRHFTFRD